MQSARMILAEGTLSFLVPIAWAIRELYLLRRPPHRPRWNQPPPPEPTPPPIPAPARLREHA